MLAIQQELQRLSITQVIDRQADARPEEAFLVDEQGDCVLTYAALRLEVAAVAQAIADQGVQPGNSVAYAMGNGRHCVVALLGIMYGGFRAVAINLVSGSETIAYVLAHSQAQLVLTQASLLEQLESALIDHEQSLPAGTPSFVCVDDTVIQHWCNSAHGRSTQATHPGPDSEDDALLMYTSGTTGRPKGVTLCQRNLIAGGRHVVIGHALTDDDRALCVLPLYHINGLCVTLFAPLVSGGSVVMPERFSTSAFWSIIEGSQCSWFSVVPTQIAYLLRDSENLSDSKPGPVVSRSPRLRFGRSASAPLSADVHRAFEQQFNVPLIETMGLTETAAQILSNPVPPGKRKPGSPGLPVGNELRIVNQALENVTQGETGELLVRGPNVMKRYFNNEQATAEALLPGGWLRTGDLGRQDSQGYFYITGRLKELIIKGGENIAPREIDDALYQHADVVEAAAFARHCENFGQRVEAAVVLKPDSTLKESTLLESCVQRLGKFKCPDRIHFLDELPKGPSGKIQRQKLAGSIDQ